MAVKKKTTKKATAKKPAKKTVSKITVKKKATMIKKKVVRKTAALKTATKKKVAPKKAVAAKKKAALKKVAKKDPVKKVAKKTTVKKAPAKKVVKKEEVPQKKTVAKKPAPKKAVKIVAVKAKVVPKKKTAPIRPTKKSSKRKAVAKKAYVPAVPSHKRTSFLKKVKMKVSRAPVREDQIVTLFAPDTLAHPFGEKLTIFGVAPYQPKKHEEYMSDGQRSHFRQILENWKLQLMEEVDRTVLHMKDEAANFPDPNDRATQEEEFSFELRTRDRERKLIKKIEASLNDIEKDFYGYCESCGVEIGIRRLEARPTAKLCIDCKTIAEIEEKQIAD